MKDELFDNLIESLDQAEAYARGNGKARSVVRTFEVPNFRAADIVRLRQKLNLTPRALANVIGVSVRTVKAWEAGDNQPSGPSQRMLYMIDKDKSVLDLLLA